MYLKTINRCQINNQKRVRLTKIKMMPVCLINPIKTHPIMKKRMLKKLKVMMSKKRKRRTSNLTLNKKKTKRLLNKKRVI